MAAGRANGIFISYRRDDAAGWPRSIRTELTRQLPDVEVFRDVDTLDAGDVWEREINDTLAKSDVVLVLIGRRFATGENRRRLNDPADTLAREISMSIAAGITIVPVLVDGARFPRLPALPEPLRVLDDFQRHEVRDVGFEGDMTALATMIQRKLDQAVVRRQEERERLAREAEAEEAERERLAREAAEAAEAAERQRLEGEAAEAAERKRLAGEAAEKSERERLEHEAAEKAERERLEREAAKAPDVAPPPPRTPEPPPPNVAPAPAVPFPMLAVLACGYSTRGGDRHELGAGRPVLDLGGRTVALVTSRTQGSKQPPGLRIFDPSGWKATLQLPLARPSEHRRRLTGPAQAEIGQYRWSGDLGGLHRRAPSVTFWSRNRTTGYALVHGLGQRGAAVFMQAAIYDPRGTQIGRVLNHTPAHPLADLGSWEATLPEGSWLLLERSLDVGEPLRSFVTAFPMLLTALWRALNGHTLAGFVPPAHRTVI